MLNLLKFAGHEILISKITSDWLKPQPVCLIHTCVQVHKRLIFLLLFCLFFRRWWRLWATQVREKQIQCNQSPHLARCLQDIVLNYSEYKFQQTASFSKQEKGNRSFQSRFDLKLMPIKPIPFLIHPFPDSPINTRYTKISADTPSKGRDCFPHRLW